LFPDERLGYGRQSLNRDGWFEQNALASKHKIVFHQGSDALSHPYGNLMVAFSQTSIYE
jgi:hypothetical protein